MVRVMKWEEVVNTNDVRDKINRSLDTKRYY